MPRLDCESPIRVNINPWAKQAAIEGPAAPPRGRRRGRRLTCGPRVPVTPRGLKDWMPGVVAAPVHYVWHLAGPPRLDATAENNSLAPAPPPPPPPPAPPRNGCDIPHVPQLRLPAICSLRRKRVLRASLRPHSSHPVPIRVALTGRLKRRPPQGRRRDRRIAIGWIGLPPIALSESPHHVHGSACRK